MNASPNHSKRSQPQVGVATVDPLLTVDPLESYDPEMQDLFDTMLQADADQIATEQEAEVGETEIGETEIGRASTAALPGDTLADNELTKVESICDVFQREWQQADTEPEIVNFIPDNIEPSLRHAVVRKLVLIDIDFRKQGDKSLVPDEYLSALPEYRDTVKAALSHTKRTVPRGYGSLGVPSGKVDRERLKLQHPNDTTSRYRTTRFHARGGLGAVFKADDEELKRVVALKEVLLDHAHNPRVQEKFVFEAEVTGSLEHPGIVPVYGLGRYEDGQPYYAMRFIRGESFRKKIEQFHLEHPSLSAGSYFSREFRALLRRLIDGCNAIHYAHEHGVIHRDIKPDNMMVGEYGETLVVDWGLAKRIAIKLPDEPDIAGVETSKAAISGSGSQTVQGIVVGTPLFMSPEQAHGRVNELDGRTDVYSLGATLFNIATGRYPITGKTAKEIIFKVREGKIESVRSLVPVAPKPLDSICRRAMAVDPSDRYATAAELADDIERWLNDELAEAHAGEESVFERGGRLIRRYRSWTISGAVMLLAITLGAIISTILVNNARQEQEVAKLAARSFKQDAVSRYQDSRAAIDTWLVQSTDALEFFPGTEAVRTRLLQIATEDYDRLASISSDDDELELERGRALIKFGDLLQMQQDFDAALEKYKSALSVFSSPIEDSVLTQRFLTEHGYTHSRIAIAFAAQNKDVEAEQSFQQAIQELNIIQSDDRAPDAARLLAATHVNFGEMLLRDGKQTEAVNQLLEAIEIYGRSDGLSDSRTVLGMSQAQELLGRSYIQQGEHQLALKFLSDAEEVLTRLVETNSDHPEYLSALASVQVSQASSFRVRGLENQLFEVLGSSIQSYHALEAAMPDVPRYIESLGMTLTDLGLALHEAGRNSEAEAVLIEANGLLSGLNSRYGQVPRFGESLATCLDALGQVTAEQSDELSDAESLYSQAENLFYELASAETSAPPDYFERLAVVLSHYARLVDRMGDTDLSKEKFDNAVQLLERCIELNGALPAYINALAHTHQHYGHSLLARRDPASQLQFELARNRWMEIVTPAATPLHDLAWLLTICPDDGVRDLRQAIVVVSKAVELAPENASILATQALTMTLSNQADQAIEVLGQTKSLRGHWIDRDFLVLAMAQHDLGQSEAAQQSLRDGIDWMQSNRPYNADVRLLRGLAESRLESEAR